MTTSAFYSGGTVTWAPGAHQIFQVFQVQEVTEASPRIVSTPGTLGGKPRIAGHRISVQDVAIWHTRMGQSVDEIAEKYALSLEDVQTALQYYADHRDTIEESIRADEAFVAEMRQRYPSTLKARGDG